MTRITRALLWLQYNNSAGLVGVRAADIFLYEDGVNGDVNTH